MCVFVRRVVFLRVLMRVRVVLPRILRAVVVFPRVCRLRRRAAMCLRLMVMLMKICLIVLRILCSCCRLVLRLMSLFTCRTPRRVIRPSARRPLVRSWLRILLCPGIVPRMSIRVPLPLMICMVVRRTCTGVVACPVILLCTCRAVFMTLRPRWLRVVMVLIPLAFV